MDSTRTRITRLRRGDRMTLHLAFGIDPGNSGAIAAVADPIPERDRNRRLSMGVRALRIYTRNGMDLPKRVALRKAIAASAAYSELRAAA